jgi:hypothetical protein
MTLQQAPYLGRPDQGQAQARMAAGNRGIHWLRTVPSSFLLSYTLDHVGTVKVDRKPAQPVMMGSAIAEGVRSIIRNDSSRDVSQ